MGNFLIVETKKIFMLEADALLINNFSLVEIAEDWENHLDAQTFNQIFSDGTERLLNCLKDSSGNEKLLLADLIKITIGIQFEYWNEQTLKRYFETLKRFVRTAENFKSDSTENVNIALNSQLQFGDSDGKIKTRNFEKVEVSPRGRLLFNKVTADIEAMGLSISLAEKRQVLLEILKNL